MALYEANDWSRTGVRVEKLEAAGVPSEEAKDWVEWTRTAVTTLNRLYPILTPSIEAKVRNIETVIPKALPETSVAEEYAKNLGRGY